MVIKVNKKTNTDAKNTYITHSPIAVWKTRAPWLIILMLSNTFTSMILSGYEQKLSALNNGALLYAFIPMLMGTAGNAGGQASVTLIRELALGQINKKNTLTVILKEFTVAILVALTVSIVCFLKLFFIDSLYTDGIDKRVAVIISLVLFVSIIMAKTVGSLLPLIAKKIGLDPAVVAGPFISTIVDVLSLIIYCSVCVHVL